MNESSPSPSAPSRASGNYQDALAPKKNRIDELAWYFMMMGFIGILLAGACFFFFRNHPLRYADFSLNANVLGKYLLVGGMGAYVIGRLIHYYRRFQRRREASLSEP